VGRCSRARWRRFVWSDLVSRLIQGEPSASAVCVLLVLLSAHRTYGCWYKWTLRRGGARVAKLRGGDDRMKRRVHDRRRGVPRRAAGTHMARMWCNAAECAAARCVFMVTMASLCGERSFGAALREGSDTVRRIDVWPRQ